MSVPLQGAADSGLGYTPGPVPPAHGEDSVQERTSASILLGTKTAGRPGGWGSWSRGTRALGGSQFSALQEAQGEVLQPGGPARLGTSP